MHVLRMALVLIGCMLPVAALAAPASVCIGGQRFNSAFDDELTHFDPRGGTWDTSYTWGRTNPGAHDDAFYVDPSLGIDPFRLTPDGLNITAGLAPPAAGATLQNHPYTSGIITTRRSFSETYGYFETKMRVPAGKGLWPAFWLLPVSGYPPELDVAEILGDSPGRVYSSTHPQTGTGAQVHADVGNPAAFHTYGMAWAPNGISFYVDGAKTGTVPNVATQPMYLVLNLQVGGAGSWPGAPASPSEFPATMTVRYVRAYRLEPGAC